MWANFARGVHEILRCHRECVEISTTPPGEHLFALTPWVTAMTDSTSFLAGGLKTAGGRELGGWDTWDHLLSRGWLDAGRAIPTASGP